MIVALAACTLFAHAAFAGRGVPGCPRAYWSREMLGIADAAPSPWKTRVGVANPEYFFGENRTPIDPGKEVVFDQNARDILKILGTSPRLRVRAPSGMGKSSALSLLAGIWEREHEGIAFQLSFPIEVHEYVRPKMIQDLLSEARARAISFGRKDLTDRFSPDNGKIAKSIRVNDLQTILDYVISEFKRELPGVPVLLIVDEASIAGMVLRQPPPRFESGPALIREDMQSAFDALAMNRPGVSVVYGETSASSCITKCDWSDIADFLKTKLGPDIPILELNPESRSSVDRYLAELTAGSPTHFDTSARAAIASYAEGKPAIIKAILSQLPETHTTFSREDIFFGYQRARQKSLVGAVVPFALHAKPVFDWFGANYHVYDYPQTRAEARFFSELRGSEKNTVILPFDEWMRPTPQIALNEERLGRHVFEVGGANWVGELVSKLNSHSKVLKLSDASSQWLKKQAGASHLPRTESEETEILTRIADILATEAKDKVSIIQSCSDQECSGLGASLERPGFRLIRKDFDVDMDANPIGNLIHWPKEGIEREKNEADFKRGTLEGIQNYLYKLDGIRSGAVEFPENAQKKLFELNDDATKLPEILIFLPPEAKIITPEMVERAYRAYRASDEGAAQ